MDTAIGLDNKDSRKKELSREAVIKDYESAKAKNEEAYLMGDVKTSEEYIYDNQKIDAANIIEKFYTSSVRVISIIKRTKVGMNGLMIEIAKNMTTHNDDAFVLHYKNIKIITGMSNVSWEEELKKTMPDCFRDNIYHHGKLQKIKSKLENPKDQLFIIDEIDCGDKEEQKLHMILKESGILSIKYMEENNIRFVFVSATIVRELRKLFKWGDKHYNYKMTIPDSYISHKDFLDLGIIKEFYIIDNMESAEKWIKTDIIDNYKDNYRVHIVRTNEKNKEYILNACINYDIEFRNHTADEKISYTDFSKIFVNIKKHMVIAVKGLFRRADLIPNDWKIKIGAVHEMHVQKYNTNAQIQGLVGRMTGYWKKNIIDGHETGPYRTSVRAIIEYEKFYANPDDLTLSYSVPKDKLFIDKIDGIKIEKTKNINIHARIPIIISVDEDTIAELISKRGKERIQYVKKLIKNQPDYKKLYDFINNNIVICQQITNSDADGSYVKHIVNSVSKSDKREPFSIDVTKKFKEINSWQVFIDNRENRLCFVLWVVNNELYEDEKVDD